MSVWPGQENYLEIKKPRCAGFGALFWRQNPAAEDFWTQGWYNKGLYFICLEDSIKPMVLFSISLKKKSDITEAILEEE